MMGDYVGMLEDKYGSNNVGYGLMILSNVFYLVPTIYIKCNKHVDFTLAIFTRGLIAMILIF